MKRRCGAKKGLLALAFASGMALSCFCPPRFLVAVLAIWVIILGLSSCRY